MGRFDGVIFDMDGTLIEPLLDFEAIRRSLGIPQGVGILEALEEMPPERRRRAQDELVAQEVGAAKRANLLTGAEAVVEAVRAAGLKTALLTRNVGEAMRIVLDRFDALRFDLTWSREDGPIKPEPDGILRACRELGIAPDRTLAVGDFHYDIQAANAAGAVSVLLAHVPKPEFADEADYVIRNLAELLQILDL